MPSDSANSPYCMLCHSVDGPPKTVVSIYGRPTNVKCEYARFPDEQACNEEIKTIKKALENHEPSIRNRHYEMTDLARTFHLYVVKAHAFK